MNTSHPFEFTSEGEADTDRLGAVLAEQLPPGLTVALLGTLGAGKTRLVQGVARGLGVAEGVVVSPTFVLAQHYAGRRTLHHFDTYRLADSDEFLQLGPEECFDSEGLTFIEWADRVADVLPRSYLRIEIEVLGERRRRFRLTGIGARGEAALERVRAAWNE